MKRSAKYAVAGIAVLSTILFGAESCEGESAADQANENLSKKAENFEVPRRIVGYNLITDQVLWSVEGYCSYEVHDDKVEAICATDRDDRKGSITRTTMGKADNATFISTQLEGVEVDFFRPKIIFRPENFIPDFDLSTSQDY